MIIINFPFKIGDKAWLADEKSVFSSKIVGIWIDEDGASVDLENYPKYASYIMIPAEQVFRTRKEARTFRANKIVGLCP